LAKIAVKFEPTPADPNGPTSGRPARQVLAGAEGWSVSDVLCTAGPRDRPFEEQHSGACIAIVIGGSFQYRSACGREMMTPGSILLGNKGQYFECTHEYGIGDRCVSFWYDSEYFETLLAELGVLGRSVSFSSLRVPPLRQMAALVARASTGLEGSSWRSLHREEQAFTGESHELESNSLARVGGSNTETSGWEELGIELAARTLQLATDSEQSRESSPAGERRVTQMIRMIEAHPDSDHRLSELARVARLSRYYFLRMFQDLTGLTPHQYVLRTRLRWAATRLLLEPARVLDIALGSGFGDISNFNRAFRAEFGVSPRTYRETASHPVISVTARRSRL
jgi:AraC family transcriptional regulator